jgi:pimeloyl-ACP methyl ester carboxylesterase
VCIHANASSSAQWRSLIELLSPTHRVLAPDCYGAGKSPEWPSDRKIRLDDEVDFLEPVLPSASESCIVVGHSYGGAVGLIAALRHPDRIRALALYEPTLFAVVDAEKPPPNGADGIRNTIAAAGAALDAGDRDGAARIFIDFWMDDGSWNLMPAQRRAVIADSIVNVRRWSHALFTEPTPAKAFADVRVPVLYMVGEKSRESAHAVARVLVPVLRHVRTVRLPGVGHMGPVTHAEMINAEIAQFAREV